MVCSSQPTAGERIKWLVCGLPKPFRQERLLVMLQGYFDDSGSEGRQPLFILAGYILPAEQWEAFADDWEHECKQIQPRINYFKLSEAINGERKFDLLPYDVRRYKILRLIEVMRKHKLHGVSASLKWAEWTEFSAGLRGPAKDQPYSNLFFLLIDVVREYQKDLGIFPQKTQLDFDLQGKAGQFAIEWYGKMLHPTTPYGFEEEYREILEGTPRMLDDKQYVPLQAADMLAGALRLSLAGEGKRDPDAFFSDFRWVYDELHADFWGGLSYSKETWDALKLRLVQSGLSYRSQWASNRKK